MGKTNKLWFKRRRYGWGWVPVTWQGWLVVVIFLTIVIGGGLTLEGAPKDELTRESAVYVLVVLLSATALYRISRAKGPAPKWRMGKKPDDNPDEDW